MPGAQLWGWDGSVDRKVRTDSDGHLQVDVLSGVGVASQLYGYDGTDTWHKLLVESPTNPNLRVALYDGANRARVSTTGKTAASTSSYSLNVASAQYVLDAETWRAVKKVAEADARTNLSIGGAAAFLYGFNGATWDRLRVGAPSDAYSNPSYALEVMNFMMGWEPTGEKWHRLKVNTDGELVVDPTALFEDTPTDGVVNKAPTSNWAYDHDADPSAHHTRAAGYLAVAEFREHPATGTFPYFPQYINDGSTASDARAGDIDQYAQVLLPSAVHITQWRQFGDTSNNGDGVWKIQYQSTEGTWIDWVTGIPTRTTEDWSTWDTSGGDVIAIGIRLVCTTVDTSIASRIGELEVKY